MNFNYVFVKPKRPSLRSTHITGKYKGKLVFKRDVKFGGVSEWIRVYFDEVYRIDEVIIGVDTIIDNLETKFDYTAYEDNLSSKQIEDLIKNGTSSHSSLEDIISSALEKTKFKTGIYSDHGGLRKMAMESDAVKSLMKKFKETDDFPKEWKKQDLEVRVIDLSDFENLLKKIEKNYDPSKNVKQNVDQNLKEVKEFLDERLKDMETLKVKTGDIIHNLKLKNLINIKTKGKMAKELLEKQKRLKEEKLKVRELKKKANKPKIDFKDPVFDGLTEDEIKLLENEVKAEDQEAAKLSKKKAEEQIRKERKEKIRKEKEAKERRRKAKLVKDRQELEQMEDNIFEQVKSGNSEIDKEIGDLLNSDDDDEDDDEDY